MTAGPVSFEDWERERIHGAIGVLATVSPDGGPHAAPVQVNVEGDTLRFETEPDARKFKNLVANPQVAICVFGSPKWGVVVRGRAEVLTADDGRGQAQVRLHPGSKATWRRREG
ncbi:MAG TPA: pyridoxamine 5'-phosphate oxidase family protein [Actinomycetota bacterium]|nr:pyridoxamine 5'-phosphate oxidase family protein [Actinomycetota bacterium]